ncbi:MAG: DUF4416 family protein [Candidatus Brocadiaceae bacterium]|nr:DUF4416 family protein [Candidatus Brocadiaceae bacterium]
MGAISKPKPVNLLIGVLTSIHELFEIIEKELESYFGAIDLRSDILPFDFTKYYDNEMGKGLQRQFFCFEELIAPERIARTKIQTNSIEESMASTKKYLVKRPINLDPGYLNESKLILASTKDFSHRIYLQDGIFAEVTLNYRDKGKYEAFPWTFPDYQSSAYHEFFLKARELYVKKLKQKDSIVWKKL